MYNEKIRVNAKKSKVMFFERMEAEVINFCTSYRVNLPTVGRCEIILEEKIEEVKGFKYLETVICKHVEMEGEIRDWVV